MNRAVFVSLAILCLLSVSSITGLIHPVKSDYAWTQTIYIRADGSISPPAAPISSVDNVTYTLTDNIAGNVPLGNIAIIIERNNTILDGTGHTLQGTKASNSYGIDLTARSNVTVKNMKITAFHYGIYLFSSSSNTVSGNNVTNSGNGIYFDSSSNNTVSGNNITSNGGYGIYLSSSSNNTFSGNNITSNNGEGSDGIYLSSSSNNILSGNNIASNSGEGIYFDSSSNNTVSGNNIASNNGGIDLHYSSSNNAVSSNNITSNNAYGIFLDSSSNNTIFHNNFVNITSQVYSSNSTNVWDNGSSGNYWSDYLTRYPHAGQVDSSGIWNMSYVIDANNTDHYPLMVPYVAVPEFPSLLILPLFMIATLLAIIVYRKKSVRMCRSWGNGDKLT